MNQTIILKWAGPAIALAALILISGCAAFYTAGSADTRHCASSAVEFLYPNETKPADTPAVPVLSLPLKVGVAFVPDATNRASNARLIGMSEERKIQLLDDVSHRFRPYPYIKSIEIIPSAYLRPWGGFVNLDQLRSMFGVDVIALVSYDQLQFTGEGLLSLTYWTIVGAYVVPGQKNDTRTMLDTVVYDIPSRTLLFRAPGISTIKGSATPVNLRAQLRGDSEKGFELAAADMATALDAQLDLFEEKVKRSPDQFKVEHKPGYKGGGHFGACELVLLFVLGTLLWRKPRN